MNRNYIAGEWIGRLRRPGATSIRRTPRTSSASTPMPTPRRPAAIAAAHACISRPGAAARYRRAPMRSTASAPNCSLARTSSVTCLRAKKARHCPRRWAKWRGPARSSASSPAKSCAPAANICRQCGPGVEVDITREAVGVVGIITPWNFPIAIPAWKIAPALAYGNCVVFKPADLVPGSAWALAEIISRAGLPAGVFNLVMGPGSRVGQTLHRPPPRRTRSASPAPSRRAAACWPQPRSASRRSSSRWAARIRWSFSTMPT